MAYHRHFWLNSRSSSPAMSEQKYRFNPRTLNFERIRLSGWQKAKRALLALTPGLLVGVLGIF